MSAPGPDISGHLTLEDGRYSIAAPFLAARFGLSEQDLRAEMRAGRVTSQVERGEGSDAGRTRLTLRHGDTTLAIRIEPDGSAFEIEPPADRPALFRMIEATRASQDGSR